MAIHYNIAWKNGTTVLKTEKVGYGELPQYVGVTPQKDADTGKKYAFDGWTPKIEKVTQDAIYSAKFIAEDDFYTITIIVNNSEYGTISACSFPDIPGGTVLSTNNNVLFIGDQQVVATATASTQQYVYSFVNWSNVDSVVSRDIVIYANFDRAVRTYKITWKNYDNSVLATSYAEYGTTPEYGGPNPTKTDSLQYTYVFAGWEPEVFAITEDTVFVAKYTQQEKTFTITISVNNDLFGSVDLGEVSNLVFGTVITQTANTLKINDTIITAIPSENNQQYTYNFVGFLGVEENVESNMVITAVFERIVNKYTIIWKNFNGDILKTDLVEYGVVPNYLGETPTKVSTSSEEIYIFDGWDKQILPVSQDEVYTAVFVSISNVYTITSTISNGEINPNGSVNVCYGASQKITFTVDKGYFVSSIKIDGVSLNLQQIQVVVVNGYTFENISSNHTIYVECEKITYTISLKLFKDGIIESEETYQIKYGENFCQNIEQLSDYNIEKIVVNNKQVSISQQLNLSNIQQDTEVQIYYKQNSSSIVVLIILIFVVVLVISIGVFVAIKKRKYY